MQQELEEIIKGIGEFKIIPFLGAGMSRPQGFKTWGEIIQVLQKELETEETDYLEVAQLFEQRFGRDALVEKLKNNYDTAIDVDNLDLHYLLLSMEPPIIYTTNYDRIIETAAEQLQRKYHKVSSLSDIVNTPHNAKQIVKFHGDFTSPENIVFTKKDYEKRLNIEHPLDILFRAHLLGKSILFLGYSFSDQNIDFIFKRHSDLYGTKLLPVSYLIAFQKNVEKEHELLKKNIRTIHLDSPNQLMEVIRSINEKVFSNDIGRQINEIFTGSVPTTVALKSDLENLQVFMGNPVYTDRQKAEKLRETVEMRRMSNEVEALLADFLCELIDATETQEIQESILYAFPHILFNDHTQLFRVCYKLLDLSANENLNYNLDNFSVIDVMSTVESKLGAESMALALLLYLGECDEKGKQLTKKNLTRIFEQLNTCGYPDVGDLQGGFPKEQQQRIIDKYVFRDRDLERILVRKSFIPRRTASQIESDIHKLFTTQMKNIK